jgi:hypothetical protein
VAVVVAAVTMLIPLREMVVQVAAVAVVLIIMLVLVVLD